MARGFGSLGVGTTDKIVTSLTAHATQRSWSIWFNKNANGGGGLGRMFDKRTASGETEIFYTAGGDIFFARVFASGSCSWRITPGYSNNVWNHLVLTYDSSSTANDPVMYYNGSSVGVTRVANTGSGAAATSTDNYVLGNRSNDNARNWDGMLAEFGVWDRILTADEAAGLGKGFAPSIYPRSLVSYEPMLRDNINPLRAAGTITGTIVRDHPRMIYPNKPFNIPLATAVAPSSGFSRGFIIA